MNELKISVCPGTLAKGHSTYSHLCLKNVFHGRQVSHILPYNKPVNDEAVVELFMNNRKRISISGVQLKLSLIQVKNKLRLTEEGEQGTHILKPIPEGLKHVDQVPANEHLTMQIAKQVFKIHTAENALVFFQDGTPAYITKRFDVDTGGKKLGVEDFASLARKTKDTDGEDFKYNYSYENIGLLIRQYIPAAKIEIEKFFSLVIFNYLFNNGDAHLKNFSVIETANRDSILSPAYDLMNTTIHGDDTYFALSDGLFENDFETESFKANGFYAFDDFLEFGRRLKIKDDRILKIISHFSNRYSLIYLLISASFLKDDLKEMYKKNYEERVKALNYSLAGEFRK